MLALPHATLTRMDGWMLVASGISALASGGMWWECGSRRRARATLDQLSMLADQIQELRNHTYMRGYADCKEDQQRALIGTVNGTVVPIQRTSPRP